MSCKLGTPQVCCHGDYLKPPSSKMDEKHAPKKQKKHRKLTANLSACKYQSVRRACKRFGFRVADEGSEAVLYWSDCSVSIDRAAELKPYQRINHFPGMTEICRKDLLARNMYRMYKLFPKDYGFFPRTWCLPADYGELQAFARGKKGATFILKPENGAQGRGIYLTRSLKDIKPGEHMICQQYVSKPFLIDDFKFDFRIYVLVTSCDPLRVFVYKDGLARFSTTPYHHPTGSNVADVYMHLTNYAINKHSDKFVRDDEEAGSKRRIITVNSWLMERGIDVAKVWLDIEDTIIKTLISCHPVVKHNYTSCFPHRGLENSACFQILGFDVLLDHKLKPWLLEVNLSPSFHTDSALDKDIKDNLLFDALKLMNWTMASKHKCMEEQKKMLEERLLQRQKAKASVCGAKEADLEKALADLSAYEDERLGGYRRIYPRADHHDYYAKFFEQARPSLCTDTAASRARQEEIRQKRLEWESMQEKGKPGKGSTRSSASSEKAVPESPVAGTRKKSSVRIPAYLRKRMLARADSGDSLLLPLSREVQPTLLDKEDELRRLSELQKRDSLVRGLGIPEILHCMFMDSGTKISSEDAYVRNHCPEKLSRSNPRTHVDPLLHAPKSCTSASFPLSTEAGYVDGEPELSRQRPFVVIKRRSSGPSLPPDGAQFCGPLYNPQMTPTLAQAVGRLSAIAYRGHCTADYLRSSRNADSASGLSLTCLPATITLRRSSISTKNMTMH